MPPQNPERETSELDERDGGRGREMWQKTDPNKWALKEVSNNPNTGITAKHFGQ